MVEDSEAILNFALEKNILDISTIQAFLMEKRKMEKQMDKIWQGKNGRWYAYIPHAQSKAKRRLIAKSTRKDLEEVIKRYCKQGPTVEEVFYEWANKKLEYGEIYKQTYDRYVNDYKRWLKDAIGQMDITTINSYWLEDFIKKTIKEREMTAKQWANMRLVINGIFKLAYKKRLIDYSISQFMADIDIGRRAFKPNYKTDESQVFTDEEARKIIAWIDIHPEKISYQGIKFVFLTGLRAGELAALKPIDIEGNVLHVRRTEVRAKDSEGHYRVSYRESTKGKYNRREVVLTEEAKSTIDRILELSNGTEYIFNGYTALNFTQTLERICESIGIPPRSMHKIRKTYCTNLLNANVPESVIKAQVGHVDISTTKNFYYFNNYSTNDRQNMLESVRLITH